MKEVYIVRLSSLGDVAMLVPVFLSFHQEYPDMRIRLITRMRFQPIFQDLDFVDIEPIDRANLDIDFLHLIRFGIQLSRVKKISLLDMHDVLRTKILRLFCQWRFQKVHIIDKGRAEKKALISENGDKSQWLKTTFHRYQEVFEKAGLPFELIPIFLKKKVKTGFQKRIGISPFAKHRSKEYDFTKMGELISRLTQENVEIHIFGFGDRERQMAEQMAQGFENVHIQIGKLTLAQELELISSLDLMISMDSGNGHLAANFGIPILTLWGTTHPKLGFGPYHQPLSYSLFPDAKLYPLLPISIFGQCPRMDYLRAIDSIEVGDIYSKVKEILYF